LPATAHAFKQRAAQAERFDYNDGGCCRVDCHQREQTVSRVMSLVVLLGIIMVAGILFFQVMVGFLLPMFLALILVVVFRPLHDWYARSLKGRQRVAAGLTTLTILLIVLLPLLLILGRAAAEGWAIVRTVRTETIRLRIDRMRARFGLTMPPEDVRWGLEAIDDTLERFRAQPLLDIQRGVLALEPHLTVIREWLLEDEPSAHAATGASMPSATARAKFNQLEKQLNELRQMHRLQRGFADDFPDALDRLRGTQRQFKLLLVGDPTMYWLKSKANPTPEDLQIVRDQTQDWLAPAALSGGQFLVNFLIGMCIMIVSLYYFLADGPAMLATVMRLSPLEDRYEEQLLEQFGTITRAVVVATLLSALAQGILAGIGFFFAGLEAVFLLSVLTMFLAMVPFVGAAAVWVPCSLWLFFEGHPIAGGVLALYGLLVVSGADNLIKPFILHGRSNLHPLLALLSVLGGVKALGPIGIFVGPMVVVFLQALLQMLHTELHALSRRAGVPA
jgi:predicted PurR-regulated permease PerM